MVFLAADLILHGLPEHLIKAGNGHILAKHPDFSPPVPLDVIIKPDDVITPMPLKVA
jgi:hypothetical protein